MYKQQMFLDIDQQLCGTFQKNMGFRYLLVSYFEKELTNLQYKVDYYKHI